MNNREIAFQNATERLKIEAKKASIPVQFQNESGFQVDIDTLTAIRKSVVKQKFYQLNGKKVSDYLPLAIGDNAFADQILTWKELITSDSFEAGISTGSESQAARLSKSDVQVQPVLVPTRYWTNELSYTLIQLGQAARAQNWGLVEAKERGRKKVWDLGIQRAAFLGLETDSSIKGLLTQADVTANTAVITKNLSSMSTSEFQTFLETVLKVYFANSNQTVYPDSFIIPNDDFLGLGAAVDETYPLKSRLQRLKESFEAVTGTMFKILPLVYAQKGKNSAVLGAGSGLNRYTMMRYDPDSILMEIPIDYTTTIQDTIQGFQYQGVAYGQFSSVKAFRPKEMIYFDHSV